MTDAAAPMGAPAAGVVPQRLAIVLPTTGEFDSRTYRIASGVAARGHEVVVLARSRPGLGTTEAQGGYRIVRVAVSAVRGLPLPDPITRAIERRRSGRHDPSPTSESPSTARPTPRTGLLRRMWAAGVRLTRIWLTVRAQSRATREVAPTADLYHGMAYMGIPVALDLGGRRRRAPVVYDARDIYLEARNLARLPGPARRLFGRVERGWARRAAAVVTVNAAYASVMTERWGVQPLVVMNCSYRTDAPTPDERRRRFHEQLGLDPAARVILYHGGLAPERGIEQLLVALSRRPPQDHLVLMGYGPLEPELRQAAQDPARAGRLHILPAVPPAELIGWVASADVAAMPIQPTTLNHRLTTPNKLFEAMTAGVPVVVSDLPGMADIVRATGCGVVCDPADPVAIAEAIGRVLDATPAVRDGFAAAARRAAAEEYSWESQLEVLLDAYGRLTGHPW